MPRPPEETIVNPEQMHLQCVKIEIEVLFDDDAAGLYKPRQ